MWRTMSCGKETSMRTKMKSTFTLGALALALVGLFATSSPAQAAVSGSVYVDSGPRYYSSYYDGPYYGRRYYYPRTYSYSYYPRTYYYTEPSSGYYYDDYYWDGYYYRPRYYIS